MGNGHSSMNTLLVQWGWNRLAQVSRTSSALGDAVLLPLMVGAPDDLVAQRQCSAARGKGSSSSTTATSVAVINCFCTACTRDAVSQHSSELFWQKRMKIHWIHWAVLKETGDIKGRIDLLNNLSLGTAVIRNSSGVQPSLQFISYSSEATFLHFCVFFLFIFLVLLVLFLFFFFSLQGFYMFRLKNKLLKCISVCLGLNLRMSYNSIGIWKKMLANTSFQSLNML